VRVCVLHRGRPEGHALANALAGDVTQNDVRRAGPSAGPTDAKVAAIDADGSGLRFTLRGT